MEAGVDDADYRKEAHFIASLIGDDGSSAVTPAKPNAKPPKKAIGGKKPGRPGAFKKKVGYQKGQGGRGKPKPGGKR